MSYNKYALKIILEHNGEAAKEIKGVKAARDPECLHRIRVASRRLRNAFRVFEDVFPEKKLNKWERALSEMAKAFGPARDLDIQIIFLKDFLEKRCPKKHKHGIENLLRTIEMRRKRAQKRVVKVLSKYEKRGLFQNISESCDRLLRAPKKDDKDKIYFVGTKNIIERLDKLLRYGAYAGRPDKIKKLHKIRIAAKHLRYTLEHFRMVYGKDTNRFIYLARRIQGFLGDVHDFNVWIEYLKPIRKKGKDTHLVKAAIYLEEEYEKRAKKAYKSFLQIWKESEEENAWQNLVRIVR